MFLKEIFFSGILAIFRVKLFYFLINVPRFHIADFFNLIRLNS